MYLYLHRYRCLFIYFVLFIFIYIYLSYVFMISFGFHDCVYLGFLVQCPQTPYQLDHVTTVSDHRVVKMNMIRNLDIGSIGNFNIAYNSTRLSKSCARVLRKTWLYRWHCFQCTTCITSAKSTRKRCLKGGGWTLRNPGSIVQNPEREMIVLEVFLCRQNTVPWHYMI